ncbi:TrbI/VirB10 family protein [Nodularia chucula]|uniref:TrbI/VirB10 family protein n=1 Tax=Nodularia chucula TaxID=3093667 RepID=UPI0039C6FB72
MTSYSIHPEISPQYLSISQKPAPKVDPHDWDSRMAQLVGFKEESPPINVDAREVESASLQPYQSQPEQISTDQSLSSNPFAKLALVGGATLALVLVAGGFLSQVMNTGSQRSTNNLVSAPAQPPEPIESAQQNLAQEVEILKTKLALAEQAQTITEAQQQLRNRVVPQMETASVRESIPRPMQTATAPRVVTVERIVERPAPDPVQPIAIAPPPARLPTPIASAPPVTIPPSPPSPPSVPSPPNPLEEWTRLAKLGSYGQVYTTGESRVSTALSAPETNANLPAQLSNSPPEATPPEADILVSQTRSQSPKAVKVGTSAKAVLATAVFGETTRSRGNEAHEDGNVFVLRLSSPLKTIDGAIALPVNTELLAEISSISERGLVELKVITVISEENGQLVEQSLPNNSITVRAPQGKPLVANQYPNEGSSIARMDLGVFVLGGISRGAELFNRTESQVTIEGSSTIVSNVNNRRNIPAGVLEGGLKSVVPQISQRNQQAISQMLQRTNLWLLPAGQEVEIYINRTMQL